ncbi:hypothetical protein MA16_Dca009519 [Dendrobium catenatum]|uniref:Uncharacterized protein n=1 Tax=Dendrobium catenatum TaxID=906689 RepID=A0A2I0VRV8_9ASPA|nr:hypothetical protein MA16_Dca009519 [Dendrobium catenatum]
MHSRLCVARVTLHPSKPHVSNLRLWPPLRMYSTSRARQDLTIQQAVHPVADYECETCQHMSTYAEARLLPIRDLPRPAHPLWIRST